MDSLKALSRRRLRVPPHSARDVRRAAVLAWQEKAAFQSDIRRQGEKILAKVRRGELRRSYSAAAPTTSIRRSTTAYRPISPLWDSPCSPSRASRTSANTGAARAGPVDVPYAHLFGGAPRRPHRWA
jgi:hypothetical protein